MKHRPVIIMLTLVLALMLGLTSCQTAGQPDPTPTRTPPPIPTAVDEQPVQVPTAEPEATPGPTPIGPYGPDEYPPDVNPLTGLPVPDPAVLERRPLLVKVSNESDSVRPQSGLAFADHVWEYQMEGFAQVRYTAVIYGETPERVGSVRSSRLIDVDHLVDMYGGMLVTSGSSSNRHDPGGPPRINELLRAAPWTARVVNADFGFGAPYLVRIPDIPRPGVASWHTLFAIPAEIWRWAAEQGFDQRPPLEGLRFDFAVPPGGTPTAEAVVDYPGIGPRHTWRYDAASGRWLSFTEFGNTTAENAPDGDTLRPGEQLAFDNVVILKADHYLADFIEDEPNQLLAVGVNLLGEGEAILLRDGQRYDVRWQRASTNSMIRFVDASGSPFPLKPGTIWFNVASSTFFPPEIAFSP